jgi:hypothetical protein
VTVDTLETKEDKLIILVFFSETISQDQQKIGNHFFQQYLGATSFEEDWTILAL